MERSHPSSGRSATPADINRNGRPTSIGTGGRHQSECPADIIGIRTKLRQGSYFPPFLELRKTAEKALVTVIQEAWIGDMSTRRVDELVQAMGLSGISKSQVSKLCKDIDVNHRTGFPGGSDP
jgi:hypothetical protein